jgi:subtilase family protein
MTLRSSFWLTRGTLPLLAVLAAAPALALPANAQVAAPISEARGISHAIGAPTRATQWWLGALNTQQAWAGALTLGAGITVAVLSTGVDAKQQDLAGNVISGPDYTGSGRSPGGTFWGAEGTAVASVIAGHGHGTGGSQGVTGIAPRARILSVRVTLEYNDPLIGHPAVTRHLPDAIARGIEYAVAHGAQVIALPLDPGWLGPSGKPSPAAGGSPAERAAVRDALAHNVILVAPAGDDALAGSPVDYPASYPGVIAVGATGRNAKLAKFSTTRPYVAMTAPGAGLAVAGPGGYVTLSTTDLSSALTAGVAALVRSRYPKLTAAQITRSLESSVTPAVPEQPGMGAGALNAAGTITAAASIFSLIGNSSPDAALGVNQFANNQASQGGTSKLLDSPVVRDGAAAAGGLIVLLLVIFLAVGGRRRRAERSPRRGGSQGGSHAKGRAHPGPGTLLRPATVSKGSNAAARASAVDALISKNHGSVHPPWEVANRLEARNSGPFPRLPAGPGPLPSLPQANSGPFPRVPPPPDSGPFPRVPPPPNSGPFPRVPPPDSGPFPRVPAPPDPRSSPRLPVRESGGFPRVPQDSGAFPGKPTQGSGPMYGRNLRKTKSGGNGQQPPEPGQRRSFGHS